MGRRRGLLSVAGLPRTLSNTCVAYGMQPLATVSCFIDASLFIGSLYKCTCLQALQRRPGMLLRAKEFHFVHVDGRRLVLARFGHGCGVAQQGCS